MLKCGCGLVRRSVWGTLADDEMVGDGGKYSMSGIGDKLGVEEGVAIECH